MKEMNIKSWDEFIYRIFLSLSNQLFPMKYKQNFNSFSTTSIKDFHLTSININYVPITNSNLYVCRKRWMVDVVMVDVVMVVKEGSKIHYSPALFIPFLPYWSFQKQLSRNSFFIWLQRVVKKKYSNTKSN